MIRLRKIIDERRTEVEQYCANNNLSSEEIFKRPCSCDKTSIFILGDGDPERAKLGLADNVPLPIALEIYLENGGLRFEQTEHTLKYLGVADKTGRRVA
jgi:hypothetical protein